MIGYGSLEPLLAIGNCGRFTRSFSPAHQNRSRSSQCSLPFFSMSTREVQSVKLRSLSPRDLNLSHAARKTSSETQFDDARGTQDELSDVDGQLQPPRPGQGRGYRLVYHVIGSVNDTEPAGKGARHQFLPPRMVLVRRVPRRHEKPRVDEDRQLPAVQVLVNPFGGIPDPVLT
jgi:hypothetical protein